MTPSGPPRIPRILLGLLLRGEEREVIVGDLGEEYATLAERIGNRQEAARWYWRQALRAVAGRTAVRIHRVLSRPIRVRPGGGGHHGLAGSQHRGHGIGGGGNMMEVLWQDVRFGLRTLARRPGFTAIAGLTLAIGVGANTAMFSVIDSVLLRPLTYPDADRIVEVWSGRTLSKSMLVRVRDAAPSFQEVSGHSTESLALTGVGVAEEIEGAAVSPNHFAVMGVQPALGRAFAAEEATVGHDAVVILSHVLWVERFGGDPGVLGRSVILGGRPRTVVGVMPAGYRPVMRRTQVWIPLTIDPTDFSDYEGTAGTRVLARLAQGATPEGARSEVEALARALHAEDPRVFDEAFVAQAVAVPMLEAKVGSTRTTLWLLLGAVGMVLLIACANVANLLLAQGSGRGQEMAIRRAMGGSRRRLIRQLLTESLLLGVLGGLAGVAVAGALLWGLKTHLASGIPRGDSIAFDGRPLAFTLALSLATTLIFGLLPAAKASRRNLRPDLVEGGRRGWGGRHRQGMNRFLMGAEVAISVVLLVGAGLMLKSLWILQHVDPGFRSEHLLTLKVTLPDDRYADSIPRVTYVSTVEERVGALPGVVDVGAITFLPMTPMRISTAYTVEGRPSPEGAQRPFAMAQLVTPGILETLDVPLVRGRWFDEADRLETGLVGVINEALAKEAFGAEDPIGRAMQMFGSLDFTVLGVIGDMRQARLDRDAHPEAYFSYYQLPALGSLYLTVLTAGAPEAAMAGVQDAVRAVDPDVPVSRVATMDEVLMATTSGTRLTTLLFSLFAGMALLLGVVGVYSVISYTVSTRTYEIGVRLAMGALHGTVTREIMGRALVPVLGGMGVGIVAALGLSLLLSNLLFQVEPWDPVVVSGAASILGAAAVLASLSPVRRAVSINPAQCLNAE